MIELSANRIPPERIVTARFVLRCWQPADAALLEAAIEASIPALQQFTPWVIPEPRHISVLEERLRKFNEQFVSGQNFIYGIFDQDEARVLGGVGLYARVGPGALEVGYWIRSDVTGRGYATAAAGVLTRLAFDGLGVERVEIRCEPENAASMVIPRRLGFRQRELLALDAEPDGQPRTLMIWELLAGEDAHNSRDANDQRNAEGP